MLKVASVRAKCERSAKYASGDADSEKMHARSRSQRTCVLMLATCQTCQMRRHYKDTKGRVPCAQQSRARPAGTYSYSSDGWHLR